ncbi:MAG: SDR family NAD(P)-dependent oxidoreductase, partial [Candidatus Bathyarchaeia archaeon]
MKLKDRIAIVTGGGSGIGRATALLFASEGANIIVADTDEKTGKETVQLIISDNGIAEFVTCDVSQSADVRKLTDTAVNKFEKIDILFNNAGIAGQHSVTEISESDWDRVLAVNLRGVFLCSKYAIPHMAKNGGGVIVNTASAVGLVGSAGQASYCASKGGVVLLTKAMALDYAKDNI